MIQNLARMIGGRVPWVLWQFGLYIPEDRKILEHCILKHYQGRAEIGRILFVGVASYVRHYAQMFPQQLFITLDRSAPRARYGGPHHVVDDLANLGIYFMPNYFDLVVMNGVIGWGLNDLHALNEALRVVHRHLRTGGELVLSTDENKPCHGQLDEVEILRQEFMPLKLPPFAASYAVARVPWQALQDHVFHFYKKKEDARSA